MLYINCIHKVHSSVLVGNRIASSDISIATNKKANYKNARTRLCPKLLGKTHIARVFSILPIIEDTMKYLLIISIAHTWSVITDRSVL